MLRNSIDKKTNPVTQLAQCLTASSYADPDMSLFKPLVSEF